MQPAQVSATNLGHSTEYVIEAATEEEVASAIERICRNYHPLGYGTAFDQPRMLEENGRWIARGSRSNSCD